MVLFVLLVTTILLYDLVFNISCFFPEKCFFFLHLVASVLYSDVIMASISEAFPNFVRLPYRLYIPSSFCQTPIKKWHANGVGQVFVTKIDQIWVCFSGQCYCYYVCVCNSLKQGISISSSYPIYSIRL